MKVTLITHTPEPEKVIASAAKLCYSSAEIDDIMNDLTEEKIESFINKLIDMGHESPLEHVTFTFGIEGISRACSHQLVRHRIASYSQKSQRYVQEEGFKYVTPPSIAACPEATQVFLETMDYLSDMYNEILQILAMDALSKSDDKNPNDYEKMKKKFAEDARFVLPNACCTSIIITMNIRSLLNFFKHRCCNRAQWEIRYMANEMLRICKEVAPTIFNNAGPDCIRKGKCPEGKMSCGNPPKKKE